MIWVRDVGEALNSLSQFQIKTGALFTRHLQPVIEFCDVLVTNLLQIYTVLEPSDRQILVGKAYIVLKTKTASLTCSMYYLTSHII
jgi:hypothetical protein